MNTLERKLDAILSDPLRAANAQGNAIGHVGTEVPLDVLWATGRHVCHLPWRTGHATPWADRWLESGFPGWARSILEDWHVGRFDGLSQVVFTRADDACQRLYYYVCELQRRGQLHGPEPLIFDLALIPRAASLARSAASIARLAAQLGVAATDFAGGIARMNRQRRLFAQLQRAREGDGVLHEKIARASLFEDLGELLGSATLPQAPSRCRVLIAGSAPPDGRLHQAVEEAGAAVVAEAHVRALTRLGAAVDASAPDLNVALAQQLTAASVGPRSFIDRADWLVQTARRERAQAVVLWLTREEEGLVWHVPAQQAALTRAQIPLRVLTGRSSNGEDDAGAHLAAFISEVCR